MMVFALNAALSLKHNHTWSMNIRELHMLRNPKRHPERAEWQLLDLYWQYFISLYMERFLRYLFSFHLFFRLLACLTQKNGAMRGRGFAVAGLLNILIPSFLAFLYGFVTAVR